LQWSWIPAQEDPDILQDPRFSVVLTSPSVNTAFSEVCIRAAQELPQPKEVEWEYTRGYGKVLQIRPTTWPLSEFSPVQAR